MNRLPILFLFVISAWYVAIVAPASAAFNAVHAFGILGFSQSAAGGGNYPAASLGYIGCSNTRDEISSYGSLSARGVFWPDYNVDNGFINVWEKDDGTQVPGTGSGIPALFYTYWDKFDTQLAASNPSGGQQLLAVWWQICVSENAINLGLAAPTNTMMDNVAAMLKKHTTDFSSTKNIATSTNFKVFVSMINTYRTKSICFIMNSGGLTGQSNVVGAVSAGSSSMTVNALHGLTVGGDGGTFSVLLDDGSQAFETVSSITGLVVGFTPVIPSGRILQNNAIVYIGDGLGQTVSSNLMQHAQGASYAGFKSVTYGPNGSAQGDAFYPTFAAENGLFYPLGVLDATITPSDTQPDHCHPSLTGDPKMGHLLANFADALVR